MSRQFGTFYIKGLIQIFDTVRHVCLALEQFLDITHLLVISDSRLTILASLSAVLRICTYTVIEEK